VFLAKQNGKITGRTKSV